MKMRQVEEKKGKGTPGWKDNVCNVLSIRGK